MQCAVSSSQLSHEFSELAVDMRLYGEDGELCSAEVEGHMDHDHDEEDHDEEDHNEEGGYVLVRMSPTEPVWWWCK